MQKDFKKSVGYQIYIKSFCDSNGDGIGDLPGITSKLDYLTRLGVDYLWSPRSFRRRSATTATTCRTTAPSIPCNGTIKDFDTLVAAAHERGIGIMLDMVLCHHVDRARVVPACVRG